jgi:hypothetical protein
LPTGAAVLLRVPLALAEQLQAGAVQHQVHGPVVRDNPGLATGEGATSPGQRGVIRNSQLEAEQTQHAAAERLGLAQGQVEDEPQGQHQLDRQVGVAGLSARCGPARCLPASKGRLVEPERQVTAPPQPGLVGGPVRHSLALLRDAVTAGGVVFEWHAGDVAGLFGSGYPAASMHQRPARTAPRPRLPPAVGRTAWASPRLVSPRAQGTKADAGPCLGRDTLLPGSGHAARRRWGFHITSFTTSPKND